MSKLLTELRPEYTGTIALNGLTANAVIVIAAEVSAALNWEINSISSSGLTAFTAKDDFIKNAEVTVSLKDGMAEVRSMSVGSQWLSREENEQHVRAFTEKFEQTRSNFSAEDLEAKYAGLEERFYEEGIAPGTYTNASDEPAPAAKEKFGDFISMFKPQPGYFITPIIVLTCIVIYALMCLSGVHPVEPDTESLLAWGANFRPLTPEGQWWRLLSSCFIHIGIFHLLMNMYALVFIGALLEPYLGKLRFTAAYLLTGIAASTASLWWHDMTVSAGASGAIFGMYGVFLAMLTTNLIEKNTRKELLSSIGIFVVYNLFMGLRGGIDNAAHIGGLVSGFIIGYAFIPGLKKPESKSLTTGVTVLLAVLVLSSSFIVGKSLPNDMARYYSAMDSFEAMEKEALEVLNNTDLPNDVLLKNLEEKGIANWNKNTELLIQVSMLNLPPDIKERNRLLLEYCRLRVEMYKLLYKTVKENTNQYESQLIDYNKKVELLLKKLNSDL